MGYRTNYVLSIFYSGPDSGGPISGEMLEEALKLADEQFTCSQGCLFLYTEEAIAWYDSHEDMLEFSKKFPDSVFCLHGVGEEDDDRWNAYYKNGKSQMCPVRFEYDEYDEEKLK